MINARQWGVYLELVRRSGVHEDIEARLRPAGKGGRPRDLQVDVFLAALMATTGAGRPLWLTEVHNTLTQELNRNLQRELGVRKKHRVLTIRQVRYLMTVIAGAYDDSVATQPHLDEDERAERTETLDEIVNRIVKASNLHVGSTHRYAVDATSIKSFAKARSMPPSEVDDQATAKRNPRSRATRRNKKRTSKKKGSSNGESLKSADPDARWGHRTATYGDWTDTFFGYHLTAFVRIDAAGAARRAVPTLTERIMFHPANNNEVPDAIRALDVLSAQTGKVEEIVADRGYSGKATENWARPIRERNILSVFDLMPSDHGSVPHEKHGYIMIDGWPHDPSVPDHLVDIERPQSFTLGSLPEKATSAEKKEHARRAADIDRFNRLIAERRLYAYERVAFQNNGAERFRCPGVRGKLLTRGCQHSAALPHDAGIPESAHPDGIEVPKACKQQTIQIPLSVTEKLRQHYYWGSPEWQKAYARRNTVERTFGQLKGSTIHPLERGWTRLMGRCKTYLLVGISVAVHNLKQLLRWAAEVGNTDDPLTLTDLADYGFEEYGPDGTLLVGPAPPAPAS